MVERIAENRPILIAEMINLGKIYLEDLLELAPLVKASTLHSGYEERQPDPNSSGGGEKLGHSSKRKRLVH
jgi:hypothetical protein